MYGSHLFIADIWLAKLHTLYTSLLQPIICGPRSSFLPGSTLFNADSIIIYQCTLSRIYFLCRHDIFLWKTEKVKSITDEGTGSGNKGGEKKEEVGSGNGRKQTSAPSRSSGRCCKPPNRLY